MAKKLWILLCLLALVMPVAACNNEGGDDAGGESPTEAPAEESPAEAPAESPS